MKEVLVKDLEVEDIFYHNNRYWIVIVNLTTCVRAKCIMSPTRGVWTIGDYHYLPKLSGVKVTLLVKDGVEV